MNDEAENIAMEGLGRQLAHETALESIIWVLLREDPSRLDRFRSRVDDYQQRAADSLPPAALAAYGDRLARLVVGLENRL